MNLNLTKKLVKCCIWSTVLYGGETCDTLVESSSEIPWKFWNGCWRRTEQIRWKHHVKNKKVLHTVKEEINMLHTMNRRKAIQIGHILHTNCLLQHGTEGKTSVFPSVPWMGKIRKKTKVATEWPWANEKTLELESGSTRSHAVNSFCKRLLTHCKIDHGMNGNTQVLVLLTASNFSLWHESFIQGVPGGMCQTLGGCSLC